MSEVKVEVDTVEGLRDALNEVLDDHGDLPDVVFADGVELSNVAVRVVDDEDGERVVIY